MLKREDVESYVALRIALQSVPDRSLEKWVEALVRKSSQSTGAYRQHIAFKKKVSSSRFDYRHLYTPGPAASLHEVRFLDVVHQHPSFATLPGVYSYRKPRSSRASHSFEYYLDGFKARRESVTRLLNAGVGDTVVILDLRSFYPSCNLEAVYDAFMERLSITSLSSGQRRQCDNTVTHILGLPGVEGLPIGPYVSHFLSNLALRVSDQALLSEFGARYHRYVDDIAVVARATEANETLRRCTGLLEDSGFEVNPDKCYSVPMDEWLATHGKDDREDTNRFEDFIARVQMFLFRRPERRSALEETLTSHGLHLPLSNVEKQIQSSGSLWRLFFALKRSGIRLRDWLSSDSEDRLADVGVSTLRSVVARAENIQTGPASVSGRRWMVQESRLAASRILALLSKNGVDQVVAMLPETDELIGLRIALEAFRDFKYDRALAFTGSPIRLLAQLHRESSRGPFVVPPATRTTQPRRDSVATLLLYGAVRVTSGWIDSFESVHDRALLRFCAGERPITRELLDGSYSDEIRSLQLGCEQPFENILSSRFDYKEDFDSARTALVDMIGS